MQISLEKCRFNHCCCRVQSFQRVIQHPSVLICCLPVELFSDRTLMLHNEKCFSFKSLNPTVLPNQRLLSTGQSLTCKHHNNVYSTNNEAKSVCSLPKKNIDVSLHRKPQACGCTERRAAGNRNKMENLHLWTSLLWPTVTLKWSVFT